MSGLLQAYREQVDGWHKAKVELAAFDAPCCGEVILTPKPPMAVQLPAKQIPTGPWRAVMECPFCGKHFHKTVCADGQVVLLTEDQIRELRHLDQLMLDRHAEVLP